MSLIPTRPPFGNWGQSPQTPCQRGEPLWTPPSDLMESEQFREWGWMRTAAAYCGHWPSQRIEHGLSGLV